MLLVLDDSLAEALNGTDGLLKKPVISALENIALGCREGKHWIFAKPKTLLTFARCPDLCRRTQSVYEGLIDDQDPGYPPRFICRVEVTALDTGPTSRMDGKCKVNRIPARYFADSKLIQETVLLAENLSDTDFYLTVAETYLVWNKLNKQINIRFEALPGGGDTTSKLYKSILEASLKRFCLCIVDSDQESPNCPNGETAKKVEEGVEKMKEEDKQFGEHLVIGVRDIENLIPTVWYSQVSEKSDRMRCVGFLEKLEHSAIAEARKYVDLKEGLNGEKILHAKQTTQVLTDWLGWLEKLGGYSTTGINQNQQQIKTEVVKRLTALEKLTGATIFSKTCIKDESCQEKQNKLCQCIITTGLGDKILADVLNLLEKMTAPQIAKDVDAPLKPEWEKIGELVTAWCCGAPIMPG